ncbi:GNAT family N-acetyltransferase [Collimonas sp. H4R21]|uniref:GNAT family N-acetyltransferase n=1 Tax=Collimonas rhizosphaerae TaxID=3126357 RepID=A0ABU9PQI0_9BURK
MTTPIILRRMDKEDFDVYSVRAIPLLAAAQAAAYGTTLEGARNSAETAFRKIDADAEPAATGQHLYVVEADGAPVGAVWFDIRQSGKEHYAYLYDWVIWPEHRGKGYGKAAMQATEQRARENSASRLMLNVFTHNRFGADLYQRYGFVTASSILVKRIDTE